MKKYKIITLEETYNILNEGGGLKWENRPLSFTFDIRKRVTETERECKNKWYAFQYVNVTDIPIVLGISYFRDSLEMEIETSKEDTIDFMRRYCEKYNPGFKGTICVDMDDWAESDPFYKQIKNEWYERGIIL